MAKKIYEDENLAVYGVINGNSRAVVSFAPMSHNFDIKGIPAQKAILSGGRDCIGVIPKSNNWYPEESIKCVKIDHILKNYSSIITYGASMGAYAAIKYSAAFRANVILSLAPQYSIDPNTVGNWDRRFTSNFKQFNENMEIKKSDVSGDIVIIYDPAHKADARHAQEISSVIEVQAVPAFYCGHNVTLPIASSSKLTSLLELAEEKNFIELKNFYRSMRKSSQHYRLTLLKGLSKRYLSIKNYDLALSFMQQAASINQSDPSVWVNISNIYSKLNLHNSALSAINHAIHANGKENAWLLKNKIDILSVSGNHVGAINLWEEASVRYPGNVDISRQFEHIARRKNK